MAGDMREKYESLSLAILRDVAKNRGIKGTSTMRKEAVIDAMLEADEKAAAAERVKTQAAETGKSVSDLEQLDSGQTINFYKVNQELYLVDLPGYGYAKVSNEIKAKWGRMIENYLHGSKQLKAVFLLIDIRHEPSANDKDMYQWILAQGYEPVIIATKLDKIKRSQVQKQLKILKDGLKLVPGTQLIPFSAETKQGRDEIWNLITSYMEETSDERGDI